MEKRRVAQVGIIAILLLVPAFYAFMFLGAYMDPAGNMSNVAIAVVNCDQGGMLDGKSKNIGSELVESLKLSDKVEWVFTDKQDADDGVLNQKYYAELVIPENFTKNISSVGDENKTQGVLFFERHYSLRCQAANRQNIFQLI